MSDAYNTFETRLRTIGRNRGQLARGYSSRVTRDGLIIFRPKPRRSGIPFRGIFLLIVGFLCFKGLVMAHIGNTVYDERVATLQQGSIVEQAGAMIMQADPVSRAVARKLMPVLW